MKKFKKISILIAALLAMGAVFVGCANNNEATTVTTASDGITLETGDGSVDEINDEETAAIYNFLCQEENTKYICAEFNDPSEINEAEEHGKIKYIDVNNIATSQYMVSYSVDTDDSTVWMATLKKDGDTYVWISSNKITFADTDTTIDKSNVNA